MSLKQKLIDDSITINREMLQLEKYISKYFYSFFSFYKSSIKLLLHLYM